MYKIEKRPSGYLMQFSGNISLPEIQQWHDELQVVFKTEKGAFWLIADMCDLNPLAKEVENVLFSGMQQYKQLHSGQRSAVVMNSPVALAQVKKLGQKAGITTERYINATLDKKAAIQKAINWVKNGVEPK